MMTVVDDKNLGFALGAADYFSKPIDWQRLNSVLRKYRKVPEPTVLIVEDDGPTREMLRRTLEKEKWKVIEAVNGRAAIDQLSSRIPSLILLDLMMPEMDGFEFMQRLRQRPECSAVPVIVVTARDLGDEERRRLNGQVARIIQKTPTSKNELLNEVRALLGTQHTGAEHIKR
jgi:DNA-binding response OmpR family regulator